MSQTTTDRNLLCAVLALRDNFISRDAFIEACLDWTGRPGWAMSDVLVDRGWIKGECRGDLESRLERAFDGSLAETVPMGETLVRPTEDRSSLPTQPGLPTNHPGLQATELAPDSTRTETLVREIRGVDLAGTELAPPTAAATGGVATTLVYGPQESTGTILRGSEDDPTGELSTVQHLPSGREPQRMGVIPGFRPSEQGSRYTLTRVCGEGALGRVWLARDADLNREVALKEIRTDHAANPHTIRRFLREAQITGQLQHPNIVPVYELARRRQDDQPFYTMKLIRGRTLRDLIRAYYGHPVEGLVEPPRLPDLLTAFIAICQALGYAHEQKVVHRDLKPENIAVGRYGEVIVLDWGIAKLLNQPDAPGDLPPIKITSEHGLTATRGLLGTPAYMAPEQADERQESIDELTDIYGLGAILFEILTGRPPHDGKTVSELLVKISQGETPRALAANSTVPPALDAICAKAMAKDRAERYPNATELAKDVERWLRDEPVSVYRDPFTARALRWARQHRTGVTAAAVFLGMALVGLTGGIVMANQQKEIYRQAVAFLDVASDDAEEMLGRVGDVDLAEVPQMELVRHELLEKAQASYTRLLAERLGQDPRIRGLRARALVRLADVETLLSHPRTAEDHYKRAVGELEQLVEQEPKNLSFRRDLARGYHGQALLLKQQDQYKASEAAFKRAIHLREVLASRDSGSRAGLIESRYHFAALLARMPKQRDKEEKEIYENAIRDQKELANQSKDRQVQLGRYRNNLGNLLESKDDLDGAEKEYDQALRIEDQLLKQSSHLVGARWMLARSGCNLGVVLLERARKADRSADRLRLTQDAGKSLENAETKLKELVAEYPAIPQYKQELARVLGNIGELWIRAQLPAKAEPYYEHVVRLGKDLMDRYPDIPEYQQLYANAAFMQNALEFNHDPQKARAAMRTALARQEALVRKYPDVRAYADRYYQNLAREAGLLRTVDPKAALQSLETATAYHKAMVKFWPEGPTYRAELREDEVVRAHVLIALGDYEAVVTVAEELPKLLPEDGQSYLGAVVTLCHGLSAIEADRRLEASRRSDLTKKLADRAMAILRDAVKRGYIRRVAPLDLPDLAPLKQREDFKRLHERLSQPSGPALG